jgi:filamentous hemagglutinin
VGNIHELFKRDGFGKDLKENSEPTHGSYNGSRIYRVTQDMPQYNLKKGDRFYLDSLHYDHLEVFNDRGTRPVAVLNLNGSFNSEKFASCVKEGRRIKDCV